MKSSLRKLGLRGFALHHRHRAKARLEPNSRFHDDDLASAAQDMRDMRNCYDSLLLAAAATTNSAYEFAESLREMGTCLLERTTLSDDDESGRILLLLGKAQFELQKLVDKYRSHIIQTITTPSESLLKELQTVEEMKRQCDDKRDAYNFLLAEHREKGSSKNAKSENFLSHKVQAAQEDYDEEVTLFVFRLKSLKQGLFRSLLTQAARHHAAQLRFFRRGVRSLEGVESHVQEVAKRRHIDYNFSGLEDDTEDEDGEDEDGDYVGDNCNDGEDEELPFDYRQTSQIHDVSTSRSSMDVDSIDHAGVSSLTVEHVPETASTRQSDFLNVSRSPLTISQSAPIFVEQKPEPSERTISTQTSFSKKFHTYALPTPDDAKGSISTVYGSLVSSRQEGMSRGLPTQTLHTSSLEPTKLTNLSRVGGDQVSPRSSTEAPTAQKETKVLMPLPSAVEPSSLRLDQFSSYDKNIKRHAYSGPLTNKASSNRHYLYPTGSLPSVEYPGSSLPVPISQPSMSPRASPNQSLHRLSSPKINELHELPRPPSSSVRARRPTSLISHSAPLMPHGQGRHSSSTMLSHEASPLPMPPGTMARSFSIPSSAPKTSIVVTVANMLETPHSPEVKEVPILLPLPLGMRSTEELANQVRT